MIKESIKARLPWIIPLVRFLRGKEGDSEEGLLDAQTVSYQEAWRWFEKQHEQAYEPLLQALIPRLGNVQTFFDIGANIGYFSKCLMDRIQFKGTAYLFEPVPHLAELCRHTFDAGPYDVHVHNFGLGEKEDSVTIYVAGDGNIGWNTLVREKTKGNMRQVGIKIMRLDDLKLPPPDFVKIDVEGAEYQVIKGMLATLKKLKKLPLILCEIGWGKSHPHFQELVDIIHELEAMGYQTQNLTGLPLRIDDVTSTTDMLLIPGKNEVHRQIEREQ